MWHNEGLKRLRWRRSIRHDRPQDSGSLLVPYQAERRADGIIPLPPCSTDFLILAGLCGRLQE
jgi:hypothetical protein